MYRELEKENVSTFYVIVADRDGVKKYVSRDFPRLFQYSVKISKARKFNTEEQAQDFINDFNGYEKYFIINPKIKKIERKFILTD